MSPDYSPKSINPYIFSNVYEKEFMELLNQKKSLLQEAYLGNEMLYFSLQLSFLWNQKRNALGIVIKEDPFNISSKNILVTEDKYYNANNREREIISRFKSGLETRLESMRASNPPTTLPIQQTISLPKQLPPQEPPRELDPFDISYLWGQKL